MTPAVGRIVHYVSYGTPGGEYGRECRAAIITEVTWSAVDENGGQEDPSVGLCVLNPTGQFFNRGVEFDAGAASGATTLCTQLVHAGGTWHWPARVG